MSGGTLLSWLRVPDTRAIATPPCSPKHGGVVAVEVQPGLSHQIKDGFGLPPGNRTKEAGKFYVNRVDWMEGPMKRAKVQPQCKWRTDSASQWMSHGAQVR